MKLREIDFGPVLDASGARNFFGEGFWFHPYWRPLGLDFSGSTFVAKTTTLEPRKGNMPVDEDGEPYNHYPDCLVVKLREGVVLNAVGLSGPGAQELFESGRWQERREPFFLSFMSVGETRSIRKTEIFEFLKMFKRYKYDFQAPIGLQINFSCPNVRARYTLKEVYNSDFFDEAADGLSLAHDTFKLPVMAKFNVLMPIEMAREISEYGFCDAICVSNTIPWGKLPREIDWRELFGSMESPLKQYGGGGLSGKPLLPLVAEWVKRARKAGITKPINAGGGILCPDDARALFDAGADSVFIGSAAILRPWRVKKIIRFAHLYAAQKGLL